MRSGKLKVSKITYALKLSGLEAPSPALETAFADALWLAWLECSKNDVYDSANEPLKTRLADCAKELMKTGWVSKRVLMEVSEGEFLEWAGLVVNYRDNFRKKEIRSNTRHVYTQRKFNLLREESEGYSKLVTLLNQVGAGALTPGPRVDAAVDEIKSLIGYFDLDPNRTCSLVLDAFTVQAHNDAFVELITKLFSAEAVTQLLGFQFSARSVVPPDGELSSSKEKEETPEKLAHVLPTGLYTAAAKLIRAGIVSLEALLGHLSPSNDEEIAAAWKQGEASLEAAVKRIGVISLTSGTGEAAGDEQQEMQRRRAGQSAAALDLDPKPLAANLINGGNGALQQRTSLLAALLRVHGAWDHAVQLLKWLSSLGVRDIAVFPEVGEALCALLAAEIAPQYERLHPGGKAQDLVAGTTSNTTSTPATAADFTISDHAMELLRLIGHHLYHDVATLTRLARLSGAVLSSGSSDVRAVEILGSYVMPAAALIPGNVALSLEVWSALSKLSYTQRFCLYGGVRDAAEKSPLLRASAKLAETEVRRILRRVTAPANRREAKLTMRPLGRMLAKITHANPLAVAEQLLRQVMGMPGMVASISEALKYLTPLAFDVATFAILLQLASRRRKLKEDGINLEEWFQWLAAFTGVLARKHEAVEVTALAQYIANQLKGCESLDILVLWELIATMTGVAPVFEVSDGQLDALSGSETLINQIIVAQLGEQSKSGNERAAERGRQRLLKALSVGSETDQLVMPLLILLAQQRKLITLQSQVSHLKLVAELYDRCQEVTVQYAEFLRKALPLSEYAALLPSIKDLAIDYAIDPEIIFELHRPLIRGIMPPAAPVEEEAEEGEATATATEDETPAAAGGGADKKEEEGRVGASPAPVVDDDEEGEINAGDGDGDANAMDVEDGEVPAGGVSGAGAYNAAALTAAAAGLPNATNTLPLMSWDDLVEQTSVLAPEGGFRGMSQTLFVTFWALALYDLDVPTARYNATLAQTRSAARAARDDLEAARRDAQRPTYGGGGHNMRQGGGGHHGAAPPQPAADMEGLAREAERLEAIAAKLPVDLKDQEANAAAVDARLKLTRGAWVLLDTPESQAAAAREFVQFCILPRVLNSPADALYCARFLRKAHALGPPGFRLLSVVDRLFKELGFLVRCCTSREATNLGIFFADLFAIVTRWRSATHYARECASSEAFRTYKSGTLHKATHSEFVKLSANWHRKFTVDVFCTCLGSADYMQMKNALLVLNRMVRIYPATKEDIQELLRMLGPIRDSDPREDLKTLARMYCTALEMAQRDKKRAVVGTRQEYAGLPPPARKKVPKSSAVTATTEENGEKEKEKEKRAEGDEENRKRRDSRRDDQSEEQQQQRNGGGGGRDREKERDRPRGRGEDRRATLRVDAPEFVPSGGKDSSRRPRPVLDEPSSKRARRDQESDRQQPVVSPPPPPPPGPGRRGGERSDRDRDGSAGKRKRDEDGKSEPRRRSEQEKLDVDSARTAARAAQADRQQRAGNDGGSGKDTSKPDRERGGRDNRDRSGRDSTITRDRDRDQPRSPREGGAEERDRRDRDERKKKESSPERAVKDGKAGSRQDLRKDSSNNGSDDEGRRGNKRQKRGDDRKQRRSKDEDTKERAPVMVVSGGGKSERDAAPERLRGRLGSNAHPSSDRAEKQQDRRNDDSKRGGSGDGGDDGRRDDGRRDERRSGRRRDSDDGGDKRKDRERGSDRSRDRQRDHGGRDSKRRNRK